MTPEQFCYWLQGFVESDGDLPSERQWQSINDHLKTVFHKVTPNHGSRLGVSLPLVPDEHPLRKWQDKILESSPRDSLRQIC